MAEVNPPAFLQNAGNVHTAEITRGILNSLTGGTFSTDSLRARGGVNQQQGGRLAVQQASSPNMTVDVLSGNALIPGSEAAKQAVYGVQNDATKNVAITASDPSLPRIDLICFKVQDTVYSGAVNSSSIVAVTGTAASSPAVPTAPANSITLAQIAVAAGVTSIVNANITDKRYFLSAAGGIATCTSTTRPATSNMQTGQFIFETDSQLVRRWDGTTSTWFQVSPYVSVNKLSGTTASVTFSSIPTSMRKVRIDYTARGTAAVANSVIQMRVNSDSTTLHYVYTSCQTINTTQTNSANVSGTDRFAVGIISAATTTSTNYGVGHIDLFGWEAPHNWLGATWYNSVYSDNATQAGQFWGGGQYIQNGPYTSITLLPDSGSFAANSEFRLEAWE
jgi:hypothetical protein